MVPGRHLERDRVLGKGEGAPLVYLSRLGSGREGAEKLYSHARRREWAQLCFGICVDLEVYYRLWLIKVDNVRLFMRGRDGPRGI